jgi:hypothetical protein
MAEIDLIQMLDAKRDRKGRIKTNGRIRSNVVRLSAYNACKKMTWDINTVYIQILSTGLMVVLEGRNEMGMRYKTNNKKMSIDIVNAVNVCLCWGSSILYKIIVF